MTYFTSSPYHKRLLNGKYQVSYSTVPTAIEFDFCSRYLARLAFGWPAPKQDTSVEPRSFIGCVGISFSYSQGQSQGHQILSLGLDWIPWIHRTGLPFLNVGVSRSCTSASVNGPTSATSNCLACQFSGSPFKDILGLEHPLALEA
jgi:hypothetical protein